MSKTYNERLVDALRETLPEDTEFVIEEGENDDWKGYVSVRHPNGANTFVLPWASDKRAAVTEDTVQREIRDIAYQLLPKRYDTAWNQARSREAHDSWVAQTNIEL